MNLVENITGQPTEGYLTCRIKQELLWRPSVSIVCMDYQAETIREYLGEKVIIYELNAENVMKYLINDLGE